MSPQVSKTLNDVYRSYNVAQQFPMVVANLKLPTNSYDINVTPDKRKARPRASHRSEANRRSAQVRQQEPACYVTAGHA